MAGQQKQIECTIQDVEHNVSTGWYAILTDRGKFTTKHRERAEEALANKGKLVLLLFDEQVVTKPAADGTNRTYTNRYYTRSQVSGTSSTSVTDAGGFTTTGAAASSGRDGDGGFTEKRGSEDPERSWRICLQTGGKLAVQTLPLLPVDQQTPENQQEIALWWARFFYFTKVPTNPMPDLRNFDDAPPVLVGAPDLPDEDPWAGLETQ